MIERHLIRRLARQAAVSEALAADSLDQMVHKIMRRLKRKEEVEVPGVAKLVPQPDGSVEAIPLKGRKRNHHEGA